MMRDVGNPEDDRLMDTVELFAGIGGFRVAADSLGWRTVWANDICPKACAVYRNRFGVAELREGDFARHQESIPAHDMLTRVQHLRGKICW